MGSKEQGRDIFEDVKAVVGCEYISDLPLVREEVFACLEKIDLQSYPAEKVKELLCYIYSKDSKGI